MDIATKQSKASKILDVALVLFITFMINAAWSVLVVIIYTIIFAARGGSISSPELIMEALYRDISLLMFSSMYNLLAIGLVFLFWRYVDRREISELGFGFTGRTRTQVLWGLLAAVAAIGAIILLGIGFGIISFEGYGIEIFQRSQIYTSLLMGVLTFVMVGFGEEAVYRTYIQKHIVEMAGQRLGLIISAFIFMAVHLLTYGKLLDLIDVFLAGIILGYAYILTKSIYLPAAFHFMWDLLQVNIFRLQDYEYYKGPVLILFNNTGNLVIGGFNMGNRLEVMFILVEILILILMYVFREKLKKLA